MTAAATTTFDPNSFFTRLSLSIVIVAVAVVGGRWLSSLATHVPTYRPRYIRRGREVQKQEHATPATEKTTVSRLLGGITFACVLLVAAVIVLLIWLNDYGLRQLIVTQTIGKALADLALRIAGTLLVLACMLSFGRLFQRIIEGRLAHARVNRNLVLLTGRIIYIVSLIVGGIVILALIWNTGIVLPVALGGALTVALSLALQDVLRNLVSGIYLLLEHPFVIGDRITLTPYTGEIEDIQIRYTALRTEDNQRVLIPNSMLFTSAVVNLSAYDVSRGVLLVTVPDNGPESIDRAEEQIRTALKSVAEVRLDPPPKIIIGGASADKMELRVVFWLPTKDISKVATLYSQIIEELLAQVEGAEVTRATASSTLA